MAKEKSFYIPLAGYEYINLHTRAIHSPRVGAIVIGDDFFISGIYKYDSFSKESPQGFPDHYHSIDTIFETHKGNHQFISCFKTESDQPITGGWATLQLAGIYNFQFINSEKINLKLGLGAALGDFGIDLKNGENWPLVPIPFLSVEYNSRAMKADFSFIVGPVLSVTIFPERKIQLHGEAEISDYRDMQDLIFTTALQYRFLTSADGTDEMAGVSVGIKNSNFGFTPGGSDKPYEIQYYSAFTELDLTLIKISGGYSFKGQERLGEESLSECGDGYFMNLQVLYQF
ncbi:hypothetical protein EXM22_01350 [Oceanispirochaeta crateris]|uniref:Uncharacterized protein n=1 Tax=Oceanispirochaeta crateris TaxID=2518645 RepID=A0A5C1QKN6_9SPIO|nr:hypothetical protein [Oceanispirochaeta crateris]QEN06702.1 hypothetical protein EXM22_01350 [Oceanispirochaeta crateris]